MVAFWRPTTTVAIIILALQLVSTTPLQAQSRSIGPCLDNITQNRRERACDELAKLVTFGDPLKPYILFNKASAQVSQGKSSEAIISLTAAIDADRDFWPAYWMRADAYDRTRHYKEAAEDWALLLKYRGGMAAVHSYLAASLDHTGKSQEALPEFQAALALDAPKSTRASILLNQGILLTDLGRIDEAIASLNAALQEDEKQVTVLRFRAGAELARGNYAAAISDLKSYIEKAPNDLYAQLWLFVAESKNGRTAKSELTRRTTNLNLATWPGPIISVLLGERSVEQIDWPPPAGPWPAADQRAGQECEAYYFAGMERLAAGDKATAIAYFQKSASTNILEFIEYRAAIAELAKQTR